MGTLGYCKAISYQTAGKGILMFPMDKITTTSDKKISKRRMRNTKRALLASVGRKTAEDPIITSETYKARNSLNPFYFKCIAGMALVG